MHNFTLFSREKRVKFEMLSLFSRNEKWNDFWFHSFREVKVKLKCLEIEIEKWNCKIILENSRETRLSQVTGTFPTVSFSRNIPRRSLKGFDKINETKVSSVLFVGIDRSFRLKSSQIGIFGGKLVVKSRKSNITCSV